MESTPLASTTALPARPASVDQNWPEKIERARQAREAGRLVRHGIPASSPEPDLAKHYHS